jgi:hypothetical protein
MVSVIVSELTGCVVAVSSRSGGSGGSFFFLLLPIAILLVLVGLTRRRGRRRTSSPRAISAETEPVHAEVLRAELAVLADDVLRLEPRVAIKEEARHDYEAATHRYRVAEAAMDYAEAPVDLVRVQRVVDEANWSMSRARAVLENRPPPAPPADLQRPGHHGEPAVRVDDGQPFYVDSAASFRSGWFSAGGGLFSGLLLGTMLGGFGGGGWIAHDNQDPDFDGFNGSDW